MKLYVLLGNLILGVIGYVIVEVRHRRKVNFKMKKLSFYPDLTTNNCFIFIQKKNKQQERRLKKQEAKDNAAREAEAAKQADIDETDDEKDDLEEDIEITHF